MSTAKSQDLVTQPPKNRKPRRRRAERRKPKRSWFVRLFRIIALFLTIVIIAMALLVGVGRVYLESNPEIKLQMTENISQRFGLPITTDDLNIRWRWAGPEITVDGLHFLHPETKQSLISFKRAHVILDVKRFIKTRILGVALIELQGSELSLERLENNELSVNKFKVKDLKALLNSTENSKFRMPNGLFNLEDIALVFNDRITAQEISLEDINLQVDKNDQLLKLDLKIDSDQLAESLELSASTPNPDLYDGFDWQVLVDAKDLHLVEINHQWQSLLPAFKNYLNKGSQSIPTLSANADLLDIASGNSDIKLYMRMTDQGIQSLNGTVGLNELVFKRSDKTIGQKINQFDFRFSLENNAEFTNLKVDKLHVNSAINIWPEENNIQLKLIKFVEDDFQSSTSAIKRNESIDEPNDFSNGKAHAPIIRSNVTSEPEAELNVEQLDLAVVNKIKLAQLQADYIGLDELSPIVEFFLQQFTVPNKYSSIKWHEVSGKLSDIKLMAGGEGQTRYDPLQVQQATVDFDKLTIPSFNNSATILGLDGSLAFSDNSGQLKLSSDGFVYKNLDVFRNTLNFDTFKTQIKFEKEDEQLDAWRLTSDNINLENSDFLINSNLDLLLSKDKSPILDSVAVVNPKTLSNLKRYYPVSIMSQVLLDWLDNGVTGGNSKQVDIKFKGAFSDYPFRNGEGEFLVKHDLSDLTIDYAEGWPVATVMDANVVYKNEGFSIDASKVRSGDLRVFPLKGRFADLKTGVLELEVNTPIAVEKAKVWINNSPLKESVGSAIESIEATGDAEAQLALQLPLKDVDNLEIQGSISFLGNPVRLDALKDPLSNLRGTLNFTKDTIFGDDFEAIYLKQLLKGKINTRNKETIIEVHTDAELGPLLGNNYAKYLRGISNVDAVLRISEKTATNKSAGLQDIKLSSNLLGTALDLPAPFSKKADSLLPLKLTIDFDVDTKTQKASGLNINGSVGDVLIRSHMNAANLSAPTAYREWILHSLALVGRDNPALFNTVDPGMARINVLGNYHSVNFDEWLEFINEDRDSEVNESLEIGVIDVGLDELNAIGQSFSNVRVVMLPGPNSWKADISNEQVEGVIELPRPWLESSRIKADIKRYHMILPKNDSKEVDFDPREIPNATVSIKDFKYEDMPLGETSFVINSKANGVELEKFTINNEAFSIEANGGWFNTTEGETSLISMELESNDLAQTLTQLGYAPIARASSANAMIELNWPTSPFGDILDELSGTVSFKLLNGELKDVDPGAGRFLALLSIAQLPKRLSLDFRDVFNSGLRYDELSADFIIQGGQAYTNNMLMKGPVADLGVIGRVGLATQDFDQAAVVQADLGSSLPVVGALAGGLGVGAAMLIFSEIFKNPLKQATQVFYKIDGSWNDPQIQRTPPSELNEVPVAPR